MKNLIFLSVFLSQLFFGFSVLKAQECTDYSFCFEQVDSFNLGVVYSLSGDGDFLYVHHWNDEFQAESLSVVDITQDGQIVGQCTVSTLGDTRAFLYRDPMHLVLSAENSVIVDVSDPVNPSILFRMDSGLVVLDGDYAYVAADGLQVYDISNSAVPFLIDENPDFHLPANSWASSGILFCAPSFQFYSYILNGSAYPVLLDYAPSAPLLGVLGISESYFIFAGGTHASPRNPTCIALSDPSNLVRPEFDLPYIPYCEQAIYDENTSFWYFIKNDEVVVYDLSDHDNQIVIHSCEIPNDELLVVGDKLVSEINNVISIREAVSEPTSLFGSLSGHRVQAISFKENEAVSVYGNQISTIDITVPSNPIIHGQFSGDFDGRDIALSSQIGFVADFNGSLITVDVQNGGDPHQISQLPLAGNPTSIACQNGLVVIGVSSHSMHLVDASVPSEPVLLSTYTTAGECLDVCLSTGVTVTAEGAYGVELIDISNVSAPINVSTYNTPGFARKVKLVGDILLVADGMAGLHLIDISNIENPSLLGTIGEIGDAVDVAVSGNIAYVIADGLKIIDFSNPSAPQLLGQFATIFNLNTVACSTDFVALALDNWAGATHQSLDFLKPQCTETNSWTIPYIQDFNDGVPLGFNTVNGNWGIIDGAYHCFNDSSGVKQVSTTGGLHWADYRVEVDIKAHGAPIQEILVRYQSPGDWYAVTVLPEPRNSISLWKSENGSPYQLLQISGFPNTATTWHRLSVEVQGPTIRASFDGSELFTFTDTNAPLLTGKVGFVAFAEQSIGWHEVFFDNLAIDQATSSFLMTAEAIDTPDDQGGFVDVIWQASIYDAPDLPNSVLTYEIQRFQESAWATLVSVPATHDNDYAVVIPTDYIFIEGEIPAYSIYRLKASTVYPETTVFSGDFYAYSIDNIPPPKPNAFIVDDHGYRYVIWDEPDIPDLAEMCVYRSTESGFIPDIPLACPEVGLYDESHLGYFYYRVQFSDTHGNLSELSDELHGQYPTGVNIVLPTMFSLEQNHPNPFNPSTTIKFSLPVSSRLNLHVFDVSGKLVKTLASNQVMEAGNYVKVWHGRDNWGQAVSTGIYFYKLSAGDYTEVRRMALIK